MTALRLSEAGNLLVEAKDGAVQLFDEAQRFERARTRCNTDRR